MVLRIGCLIWAKELFWPLESTFFAHWHVREVKNDPRVKYHRNINPNSNHSLSKALEQSQMKPHSIQVQRTRGNFKRSTFSHALKICAKSGGLSDLWCERGFQQLAVRGCFCLIFHLYPGAATKATALYARTTYTPGDESEQLLSTFFRPCVLLVE